MCATNSNSLLILLLKLTFTIKSVYQVVVGRLLVLVAVRGVLGILDAVTVLRYLGPQKGTRHVVIVFIAHIEGAARFEGGTCIYRYPHPSVMLVKAKI